jgi:DNA-binding XRE family transcriptional regulator
MQHKPLVVNYNLSNNLTVYFKKYLFAVLLLLICKPNFICTTYYYNMPHQNNDYVPGELIKLLRTLKGIKQEYVAKKLGIKQQAISKLEKCGRVSVCKFSQIVQLFNCTQDDIEAAKKVLPPPPRN